MANADVIRELTEKWNAGDLDSVADLYTEDAEIRTGPHWPEDTTYQGRDSIRETTAEWASMWDKLQIEVGTLEELGDKLVVTGAWRMRGAASGVDGEMAIFILFTFREGKIARARVVRRSRFGRRGRPRRLTSTAAPGEAAGWSSPGGPAGCSAARLVERVLVLGEVVLGDR